MVRRKLAINIRKTHRYLGLFIGVQFLLWTISGLYFSWTDIDEIHGDQFKKEAVLLSSFANLQSPSKLQPTVPLKSLELKDIAGEPFYWVNEEILLHARTGALKKEITEDEATKIAEKNMRDGLLVENIRRIENVDEHHEYRGRPLPAFVISYKSTNDIKAYVSITDGKFQTLRHRDWRFFDFLWMTHTMDYEGRDNFNTVILRAFSLLGLLTVLSGFLLWYISSPTVRRLVKLKRN
ncbi:PepSY domain-containing protein [Aquimarina sp. 2-A2]|uniref:PepSY domain-containing protein n=1 Tax=Aquimarina sp. 2-A2 TaxID=3382644 RepID=UPI00387EF930